MEIDLGFREKGEERIGFWKGELEWKTLIGKTLPPETIGLCSGRVRMPFIITYSYRLMLV